MLEMLISQTVSSHHTLFSKAPALHSPKPVELCLQDGVASSAAKFVKAS
jgi:hypothetical protein